MKRGWPGCKNGGLISRQSPERERREGGGTIVKTGRLWVVGLGPGDQALMPPLTWEVLRQADVLIGYSAYFAGLEDLRNKETISLPLGQERERAAIAVERARSGQAVAVISSGDSGIYGMASIVLETLEQQGGVDVDFAVIPGISAINAAASLL